MIGEFHAPDFLTDRAREGSLLMPEKLALQQASGNGGAIQLHKRALFAPAAIVDGASDQFFAGAGFAKQQDSGIAGRDGLNQLQNMFNAGLFPMIRSNPISLRSSSSR